LEFLVIISLLLLLGTTIYVGWKFIFDLGHNFYVNWKTKGAGAAGRGWSARSSPVEERC